MTHYIRKKTLFVCNSNLSKKKKKVDAQELQDLVYFSTLKMGKKKLNMMGLAPTTLSFQSHALFTDLELQFLFDDAFLCSLFKPR